MLHIRHISLYLILLTLTLLSFSFPFIGLTLIIGALSSIIGIIVSYVKKKKENIVFNSIYLLLIIPFYATLKYWDYSKIILLISLITCIYLNIRLIKSRKEKVLPLIIFSLITCFTFGFFIEKHHVFAYRHSYIFKKEADNHDVAFYHQYSWYLYQGDEYEKALNANQIARDAFVHHRKFSHIRIKDLEKAKKLIETRTWKSNEIVYFEFFKFLI